MRFTNPALAAGMLCMVACAHLPQHAAGPVTPDRPGYTDGAVPLAPGVVQVEGGVTSDRTAAAAYDSYGEMLVRGGVAPRVELRLFGNSFGVRRATDGIVSRGLEDAKVGVKVGLVSRPDSVAGPLPNVALLLATTVPSGTPGMGAGAAQPEVKVALSWTTGTPVSVYANSALARSWDGSAWSTRAAVSVATWCAVTSRFAVFGEGISIRSMSGPMPPAAYADAGATFLLTDQIQVDARFGRGVGRGVSEERFVGLGIARRW